MKKLALLAALAGALALPGTASASVISTLNSWGVNTAAIGAADDVAHSYYSTTPGLGFSQVVGDYVGPDGRVGAGIGGQRYDLEAMYVGLSGNILTVAGITGALWNPSNPGAWDFGIGDLFLGSGSGSSFTGYGVELTGAMYSMDSEGFTTGARTNTYSGIGSLHGVSAGVGYADGFAGPRANDPNGAPGQLVNRGFGAFGGDGYDDGTPEYDATFIANNVASISWEQFAGNRHSAFIAQIDLSLMMPTIMNQWGGNILLHWGEVCTNDYLELNYQIGTVPAPGSLLLVGAGLFALAGLRRRRSVSSVS